MTSLSYSLRITPSTKLSSTSTQSHGSRSLMPSSIMSPGAIDRHCSFSNFEEATTRDSHWASASLRCCASCDCCSNFEDERNDLVVILAIGPSLRRCPTAPEVLPFDGFGRGVQPAGFSRRRRSFSLRFFSDAELLRCRFSQEAIC